MDFSRNSANSSSETTEMYVKKVLAGSIEDVHRRIINSMESAGYDIIEESPRIIGRRGAKGWGMWYGSAGVLDYPRTLTVRLKSLGESTTRVTFDYLIRHPMLSKRDLNVVRQEAKTIAALAKVQSIEKVCSVCETESTDDSRFCRNCGAPLTTEQTEMEVLRMTAETRAGQASVFSAGVLSSISFILITLAIILGATKVVDLKGLMLLLSFGLTGIVMTMYSIFFGLNRLRKALKKPPEQTQTFRSDIPKTFETGEFQEFSPPKSVASITEGTTNLLDDEWVQGQTREKLPVSNRRETNELDEKL